MGMGFTAKCRGIFCRYEKKFYLGNGFMTFHDMKTTIEIKTGKHGEYLRTICLQNPEAYVRHSNTAYQCPRCNHLEQYDDISLEGVMGTGTSKGKNISLKLGEGFEVIREYSHYCPNCNSKMYEITNYNNIHCPKCGKNLKITNQFNWD